MVSYQKNPLFNSAVPLTIGIVWDKGFRYAPALMRLYCGIIKRRMKKEITLNADDYDFKTKV
jgi:hypothetical protein